MAENSAEEEKQRLVDGEEVPEKRNDKRDGTRLVAGLQPIAAIFSCHPVAYRFG